VKKWRVGRLQGEPRVQPQLSRPEERLNALSERVESVLTSVVALFLMGFVVVALAAIVAEVRRPLFVDHTLSLNRVLRIGPSPTGRAGSRRQGCGR
jgi:anaerobic C4-dicarboxylate transporter